VYYAEWTQDNWDQQVRKRGGDPYTALAELAGNAAADIWCSPIADSYNRAVPIYQQQFGCWRPAERALAGNILHYYKSHCDGHLELGHLVAKLMPGLEHHFDNGYGSHSPLAELPFGPTRNDAETGPARPGAAETNQDQLPSGHVHDPEVLILRLDQHMFELSAQSARFLQWTAQSDSNRRLVEQLVVDSAWGFVYQPELLRPLWRRVMRNETEPAARLAQAVGYQAQTIWGSVDAPAVRYKRGVDIYVRNEQSWARRKRLSAQFVLRHYHLHCAGQLSLRDLVAELLPGYERHFDEGYGHHPALKPLPF
jgi:hypothetical protein